MWSIVRQSARIGRPMTQPCRRTLCRPFWTAVGVQDVPNTGSVARDILAAERTFLAWARTGLGFVGAGSALAAAYHRNEDHSRSDNTKMDFSTSVARQVLPASALLIANGAFLLAFATRRYAAVLSALKRDMFPIDARGTLMAIVFTSVNTIASLAIVCSAESASRKANRDDFDRRSPR